MGAPERTGLRADSTGVSWSPLLLRESFGPVSVRSRSRGMHDALLPPGKAICLLRSGAAAEAL
jgi:hypothetical protein